jgi:hypothetical protein
VVRTGVGDQSMAEVNANEGTAGEAEVQPSCFLRTAAFVQTGEVQVVEGYCNPEFLEAERHEQGPHISEGVANIECVRSPHEQEVTNTPVQCATTHSAPPLPPRSQSHFMTGKSALSPQLASRSTFPTASEGVRLQTGVRAFHGSGMQNPTVCTPTKSHEDMRRDLNDMLEQLPATEQVKFLQGKRKV